MGSSRCRPSVTLLGLQPVKTSSPSRRPCRRFRLTVTPAAGADSVPKNAFSSRQLNEMEISFIKETARCPLLLSSPGGVLRCSSPFRCTSMVFDHAVGDKHRLTLFGCPLGGQERPGSRHSTAQPETRRCDYRTRRPSRQSSRCTTWHLPHLPGH